MTKGIRLDWDDSGLTMYFVGNVKPREALRALQYATHIIKQSIGQDMLTMMRVSLHDKMKWLKEEVMI